MALESSRFLRRWIRTPDPPPPPPQMHATGYELDDDNAVVLPGRMGARDAGGGRANRDGELRASDGALKHRRRAVPPSCDDDGHDHDDDNDGYKGKPRGSGPGDVMARWAKAILLGYFALLAFAAVAGRLARDWKRTPQSGGTRLGRGKNAAPNGQRGTQGDDEHLRRKNAAAPDGQQKPQSADDNLNAPPDGRHESRHESRGGAEELRRGENSGSAAAGVGQFCGACHYQNKYKYPHKTQRGKISCNEKMRWSVDHAHVSAEEWKRENLQYCTSYRGCDEAGETVTCVGPPRFCGACHYRNKYKHRKQKGKISCNEKMRWAIDNTHADAEEWKRENLQYCTSTQGCNEAGETVTCEGSAP